MIAKITSIYLYISLVYSFGFQERTIILEEFNGRCLEDVVIYYENMELYVKNKYLYNYHTVVVTENIKNQLKYVISIENCKNSKNFVCKKFNQFTSEKYCDLIVSNSPVWKSLFSHYVPKWRCPIRKGRYVANNSTFDISTVLMLPFDPNEIWVANMKLIDLKTNATLMCTHMKLKFAIETK